MATCLECSGELPNHRPGCDMPAVEAVRAAVLAGANPRTLQQVYDGALQAQPAPTGNGPEVLPVVIDLLTKRQEHGLKKYGTALRAHNGRSALRDAKEEAADQLMYLTQLEMEWPRLVAHVRVAALAEVEQLLERHMLVETGQEQGAFTQVVNGALRRVYADVREMLGKPPVEPEPARGRRRGKPHRWEVRAPKDESGGGDPQKRWGCKDCPLERHGDRGPLGGSVQVFMVGDEVLARGNFATVRVPSCPPAPKGGA